MAHEIGTAELTIEPKLGEGFAELKAWGLPDPRVEALSQAIASVRPFDPPPSADHIVERATAFLAFLVPDA